MTDSDSTRNAADSSPLLPVPVCSLKLSKLMRSTKLYPFTTEVMILQPNPRWLQPFLERWAGYGLRDADNPVLHRAGSALYM